MVAAGQELSQTPLAEGKYFQWSRRVQKVLLDLFGQLQQIHDLGYSSPRKAFSGRDFRSGDPGVALHFLAPETGLLIRVYADGFVIVIVARF